MVKEIYNCLKRFFFFEKRYFFKLFIIIACFLFVNLFFFFSLFKIQAETNAYNCSTDGKCKAQPGPGPNTCRYPLLKKEKDPQGYYIQCTDKDLINGEDCYCSKRICENGRCIPVPATSCDDEDECTLNEHCPPEPYEMEYSIYWSVNWYPVKDPNCDDSTCPWGWSCPCWYRGDITLKVEGNFNTRCYSSAGIVTRCNPGLGLGGYPSNRFFQGSAKIKKTEKITFTWSGDLVKPICPGGIFPGGCAESQEDCRLSNEPPGEGPSSWCEPVPEILRGEWYQKVQIGQICITTAPGARLKIDGQDNQIVEPNQTRCFPYEPEMTIIPVYPSPLYERGYCISDADCGPPVYECKRDPPDSYIVKKSLYCYNNKCYWYTDGRGNIIEETVKKGTVSTRQYCKSNTEIGEEISGLRCPDGVEQKSPCGKIYLEEVFQERVQDCGCSFAGMTCVSSPLQGCYFYPEGGICYLKVDPKTGKTYKECKYRGWHRVCQGEGKAPIYECQECVGEGTVYEKCKECQGDNMCLNITSIEGKTPLIFCMPCNECRSFQGYFCEQTGKPCIIYGCKNNPQKPCNSDEDCPGEDNKCIGMPGGCPPTGKERKPQACIFAFRKCVPCKIVNQILDEKGAMCVPTYTKLGTILPLCIAEETRFSVCVPGSPPKQCEISAGQSGKCIAGTICEPPYFNITCNGVCYEEEPINPGPEPEPGPGPNPKPPYGPFYPYKCNIYNQCTPYGTGKLCLRAEDCQNSSTRCNEDLKCVEGGTGIACDTDEDCENSSGGCNKENRCVPGGPGKRCRTDEDCENSETRCTVDGHCDKTGTLEACDNAQQCRLGETRCNDDFNRCVIGPCGKECKDDSDCSESITRCDENRRCVVRDTGPACTTDKDCEYCPSEGQLGPFGCNEYNQCVVGGCGKECESGIDCQYSIKRCDENMRCIFEGTGAACENDEECQRCPYSCNEFNQCVPGGGDKQCENSQECRESIWRCNEEGRCVKEGRGIACDGEETCLYYPASCNEARECVPGGGGALCLSDEDCEEIEFGCNPGRQCVPGGGGDACSSDQDCMCGLTDLKVLAGPYCTGLDGAGIAYFTFQYRNCGTPKSLEFQIAKDKDFNDLVVDRTTSTSFNSQVVLVTLSPVSDRILYNTEYYWRVRVLDTDGEWSDWFYYNGNENEGATDPEEAVEYIYPFEHPSPFPVFTAEPQKAEPGDTIYYKDFSKCYTKEEGYLCRESDSTTYRWDFGDGSEKDETKGDITHIYTSKGKYNTTLEVCDDIACCPYARPIEIRARSGEIPFWREISPF